MKPKPTMRRKVLSKSIIPETDPTVSSAHLSGTSTGILRAESEPLDVSSSLRLRNSLTGRSLASFGTPGWPASAGPGSGLGPHSRKEEPDAEIKEKQKDI